MHKNPYKHRFIAGSSKCSTKPVSILLTKCLHILSNVFRSTARQPFSRSGINQSFDFSTLYTTIPHQKLKSRLATIIRNSYIHKNGNRRYKFFGFRSRRALFCQGTLRFENKYTEDDIVNMLEFLVDNIFVVFGERFSNR